MNPFIVAMHKECNSCRVLFKSLWRIKKFVGFALGPIQGKMFVNFHPKIYRRGIVYRISPRGVLEMKVFNWRFMTANV